jgi:hypothetical protein
MSENKIKDITCDTGLEKISTVHITIHIFKVYFYDVENTVFLPFPSLS